MTSRPFGCSTRSRATPAQVHVGAEGIAYWTVLNGVEGIYDVLDKQCQEEEFYRRAKVPGEFERIRRRQGE
eukprot:6407655-Lingulodinium_polyedra.AAC.1